MTRNWGRCQIAAVVHWRHSHGRPPTIRVGESNNGPTEYRQQNGRRWLTFMRCSTPPSRACSLPSPPALFRPPSSGATPIDVPARRTGSPSLVRQRAHRTIQTCLKSVTGPPGWGGIIYAAEANGGKQHHPPQFLFPPPPRGRYVTVACCARAMSPGAAEWESGICYRQQPSQQVYSARHNGSADARTPRLTRRVSGTMAKKRASSQIQHVNVNAKSGTMRTASRQRRHSV